MFSRFFSDQSGTSGAEYALTLGVLGFGLVLGNVAIANGVSSAMESQPAAVSASADSYSNGGGGSGGGNANGNGGSGGSGGGTNDGGSTDGSPVDNGPGNSGNGGSNCKPKKSC